MSERRAATSIAFLRLFICALRFRLSHRPSPQGSCASSLTKVACEPASDRRTSIFAGSRANVPRLLRTSRLARWTPSPNPCRDGFPARPGRIVQCEVELELIRELGHRWVPPEGNPPGELPARLKAEAATVPVRSRATATSDDTRHWSLLCSGALTVVSHALSARDPVGLGTCGVPKRSHRHRATSQLQPRRLLRPDLGSDVPSPFVDPDRPAASRTHRPLAKLGPHRTTLSPKRTRSHSRTARSPAADYGAAARPSASHGRALGTSRGRAR